MRFGRILLRRADALLQRLIAAFFLLLLLYGAYGLWDSAQICRQADGTVFQSYRPQPDSVQSFADLQASNPEVFGWLTVDGTHIDTPLVQAETNTKYVNTDVNGHFSLSGSIFLDARNAPNFSDGNSILYGHHLQTGGMFSDLERFSSPDFFNTHTEGSLFHSGVWHTIEFFAFLEADAYDPTLFNTEPEENPAYLDYVNQHALLVRPVAPDPKAHYITLSTCSDASTNGRFLLIGRIHDDTA